MNNKIKNLGKSGMVYRRGQQIVLENEKTTEHVAVKVVMHDSMQGWLAENGDGDYQWYREHKQEKDPTETEYWKYIKKVKKFGTSGMVFRRGQQIVLENEKTTEHVAVKVIMHDSMQGWLAENGDGDYLWYREHKQEKDPTETDYWKYIKKAGT